MLLTVADAGPGIAPADLENLFVPFFRTAEARRSGTPGTGLGLSIARAIVERHGGALEVESEPGRGTRFAIRLPDGS